MKKTNIFKTLVVVLAIAVGLTFTQCGVSDRDVERYAKQLNETMKCPVKVDYMTMLDSIYAMPGKELHYHYTIVDHTCKDMNSLVSKAEFERNIRISILALVNAENKDASSFRRLKIIIVSEYYDKNGELYSTVRVGPKEYE